MLINNIAALDFRQACLYSTKHNPDVATTGDSAVIPAITYLNADIQKLDIINDNIKKAGIYRWTSLLTGKSYIGSSRMCGCFIRKI